jgi:hypothetical protein
MQHTEAAKLMAAHKWERLRRPGPRFAAARSPQRWQKKLRDVAMRAETNPATGHVILTVICKTADELEIVLDELGV